MIPKNWLKHGERGHYNEWTIKETYKKRLAKEFGDDYLHSTERLEVLEWNQIENVAYMINKANKIGFFDILEIAKKVSPMDVKYTHSVAI